jgi:hypothetical protein
MKGPSGGRSFVAVGQTALRSARLKAVPFPFVPEALKAELLIA